MVIIKLSDPPEYTPSPISIYLAPVDFPLGLKIIAAHPVTALSPSISEQLMPLFGGSTGSGVGETIAVVRLLLAGVNFPLVVVTPSPPSTSKIAIPVGVNSHFSPETQRLK